MNNIKDKLQICNKRIVIFGAGKIGRSFIGQLFGRNGYELVFIDVDQKLIETLNSEKSYKVIFKSDKKDETFLINNVKAVSGVDTEQAAREVVQAGIIAVSVGKNALSKVLPTIAQGLSIRYETFGETFPLDIILAENLREAALFVSYELKKWLPANFPVDDYTGLIEASIGKMVPFVVEGGAEEDPLTVSAEPYNTLILDGSSFRNPIPEIDDLAPKENIKPWIDRKAFIHNLGHVTVSYFGTFNYPEKVYLYEVLEDKDVEKFTREVMQEAADILYHVYPTEFSKADLNAHIEDLVSRFKNKALKDTFFRIGQDLPRKLSPDDRFMGIIRLAQSVNKSYQKIMEAMVYALHFKASAADGSRPAYDLEFQQKLETDFENTLRSTCGLKNNADDRQLFQAVEFLYNELVTTETI